MYSSSNLRSLYRLIAKTSNQPIIKTENYSAILSQYSCWPNVIFSFSDNLHQLEDTLGEIKQKIRRKELPSVLMANPEECSSALISIIENKGFRKSKWTAMSMNLETLEHPQELINFRITKVSSKKEMNHWIRLVEKVLMGGKSLDKSLFQSLLKTTSLQFYLGYHNDIPVCTSLSHFNDTSVGIYLVGTLPDYQRKGFGKQITIKPLHDAFIADVKVAFLQTTDAGKPVYSSIGFKNEGSIHVYNLASHSSK